MKWLCGITMAIWMACMGGAVQAGTFTYDFSSGLNSTYWNVYENNAGQYSTSTNDGLQLSKTDLEPTGDEYIGVQLNLNALLDGYSLIGDFDFSLSYHDAVLTSSDDRIELYVNFPTYQAYALTIDGPATEGYLRYTSFGDNATYGPADADTKGTLRIARVDDTIFGYVNDQLVGSSETSFYNYDVWGLGFVLRNMNGSADATSVILDSFSITSDLIMVPEPATLGLLAMGGIAMLARRRRSTR